MNVESVLGKVILKRQTIIKVISGNFKAFKLFHNMRFSKSKDNEWERIWYLFNNLDLSIKNKYTEKLLIDFLKFINTKTEAEKNEIIKTIKAELIILFNSNNYNNTDIIKIIISNCNDFTDSYLLENFLHLIFKNNLFDEVKNNYKLMHNIVGMSQGKPYYDILLNKLSDDDIFNILKNRKRISMFDFELIKKIDLEKYDLSNCPKCFYYCLDFFKILILKKQYNVNIIDKYKGNETDVSFALQLLDKGYIISKKSSIYLFFSYYEILEHAIIDLKQDMEIIRFFQYQISDKLAVFLFEKGFEFKSEIKQCSDSFCKYYYENKFKTEKLDNILQNHLYGDYRNLVDFLDNIGDLTKYNVSDKEFLDILRFLYFRFGRNYGFELVIRNNKMLDMIKIYKLLCDKWDIHKFNELISNYSNTEAICELVLNNIDIVQNAEIRNNLVNILIYGSIDVDRITNINELMQYNNIKFIENKDIIARGDLSKCKEMIFKTLFNLDLYYIKDLVKSYIDSKSFDYLLNSIHAPNHIEVLKEYKLVIRFIISIYNCNDKEELILIANKINDFYINGKINIINNCWLTFKNLKQDINYILGDEINEKIIDIDSMINTDISEIPKNKDGKPGYILDEVEVKKTFKYFDSCIQKGHRVKYLELTGIPFVALGHTLNAFGDGGKLSDFTMPRIIGKPHICLTGISDCHYNLAINYKEDSIDNVQLLFTNLPSEKFLLGSNRDLDTSSYDNDLDINSYYLGNLNPIRYNISNTSQGEINEYVYYRDGLRPTGILIRGRHPNEAEIQAAAYLNIPLVKINKKCYPKRKPRENFIYDDSLYEYYQQLYNLRTNNKNNDDVEQIRSLSHFLSEFLNQEEVFSARRK